MKPTLLFLILYAFAFPAGLNAEQTVTAKGLSFFEPGREAVGREKALDEAKRSAIEKAVGVAIESRTVVENFQVVKDQIFSRTSGYLKNIKILEERKTDLGTYEVEIQALVKIAALVEDLDRFQKLVQWQKNPRVRIILESGMEANSKAATRKTANILTSKLQQNGFKVFKEIEGQNIQMGLLIGLILEHSSLKSTYQDLEISLNEISMSANVYRPGDGEILATSSVVKTLPGENKLQALDKGARMCIDTMWQELRSTLIRLWEKELYSERDIFLVIKTVPFHARAAEIGRIFESDFTGVRGVQLIAFKNHKAEYNLKYRGWPEQFFNEIQMSYFKNSYFDSELIEIAGNKIVIRLK